MEQADKTRVAFKTAFTLIELLVVISIIALLMAILLPSLGAAKQHAMCTVCMAHQKGLVTSYMLYLQSSDDNLPNANVMPSNKYTWVNSPTLENGTRVAGPGQDVTLRDRQRGIENGLMFPYAENVKLFHCPGDDRLSRGTNLGSSLAYRMYRSYNIQGGLNGEEVYRSSKGVCPNKYTRIGKNPASIYVFVEEYYDGRYANNNAGSWQIDSADNGHSWWNIMSVWHNEKSTLSFVDGHVDKMRWKDKRTFQYANDRQSVSADQPDNPDLKFMIDGYAVPLPRR